MVRLLSLSYYNNKNDFCYVQTIGITYTYNGGKIQDAINDD